MRYTLRLQISQDVFSYCQHIRYPSTLNSQKQPFFYNMSTRERVLNKCAYIAKMTKLLSDVKILAAIS